MVTINVDLSEEAAMALAQFLKRLGFQEWRAKAQDNDEVYAMREGCEQVARSLAQAGFSPR